MEKEEQEIITREQAEEMIASALAQQAAKQKREEKFGKSTGGASPLAVDDAGDIVVGNDVAAPWAKRTVKFFNAVALGKDNMAESLELLRDYAQEVRDMPEAQRKAEDAEALRILRSAGLPSHVIQRTMSTLSDGAGQVLLPKPFLAEVFVIVEEYGVGRRVCRVVPMTTRDLDLKSIATKPSFGFVDQLGLIPVSDMAFAADQKLSTYKGGAITTWSRELEEDEAIALLPQYQMLIGEGIAQWEDQVVFIADGTSTYKSQTGILHGAANVYTMPSTKTAFTDLTADDLNKAMYKLSTSSRKDARWYMHYSITGIIERLKGSDGHYIYRRPEDPSRPATLWGRPVEEVEVMPDDADTAVSTKFIAFGDGKHALLGQRRGVTVDLFSEGVLSDGDGVVTFNALQQDASILRVTERFGVKIPTPNTSRFVAIRTAAS